MHTGILYGVNLNQTTISDDTMYILYVANFNHP